MKKTQFLLVKLAEECNEVAQRALKQFQFGPLEVQKGQDLTNAERLKQELVDLLSVYKLLIDELEIPEITSRELYEGLENKRKKLAKYLEYSILLGELSVDSIL